MRISNQTPINPTDATTPSTGRTDSPTSSAVSNPGAAHPDTPLPSVVSAMDYSVVPSFELLSLNAALSEIPPIRRDVLAETIRRLAAGDLQTPSALEQTALAILG